LPFLPFCGIVRGVILSEPRFQAGLPGLPLARRRQKWQDRGKDVAKTARVATGMAMNHIFKLPSLAGKGSQAGAGTRTNTEETEARWRRELVFSSQVYHRHEDGARAVSAGAADSPIGPWTEQRIAPGPLEEYNASNCGACEEGIDQRCRQRTHAPEPPRARGPCRGLSRPRAKPRRRSASASSGHDAASRSAAAAIRPSAASLRCSR